MKVLLVSLLLLGTLFAQQSKLDSLENVVKNDSQNIDAMFNLATIYYNMVSKQENDDATERAEELLKAILQKKNDHTEAMVYYGSLLTLKGRDAFLPWSKLSYVEEGCELMDKAVRLDPKNIRLRIRRAMNNVNLPSPFNRQAYYLEDFEFIRNHPAFLTFNADFQQQILFYSAIAYEKNNEPKKSREMYQQVIDLNKNSELAKRASEAVIQ
jgi:tetratricopeptide (TPR) repeat protein